MKPVGVGLIGLGNVATTHADALDSLPQARLVAVYSHSAERVKTFASRYSARPCTSAEDVFADPAVDVVDICTPHPTHASLAIRAAHRGRHVLVEKPMAPTLADCDAMIDAAARSGVRLGVISQRRWYEPVQRMHAAIEAGKIGMPILGTITLLGWRDEGYYRLAPWRGSWSGEGGGVLVNQASHHLDLLLWLMGPVADVFGFWANLSHPYIEVEDTSVVVLRFVSGALGSVTLSNSQEPGLFGKIHVHGRSGASVGVQTEAGSAFVAGVTTHVDPAFNDLWTIAGEESSLPHWQQEDRAASARIDPMTYYHRLQIADFVEAVAENREPLVTGDDGRRAVELFAAVYASQRANAPVRLPMASSAERDDQRQAGSRREGPTTADAWDRDLEARAT
jgi:UDP-N-acetyl-2-amino-2-deoxyglucuronate dehydrogenase